MLLSSALHVQFAPGQFALGSLAPWPLAPLEVVAEVGECSLYVAVPEGLADTMFPRLDTLCLNGRSRR